MKMILRANQNPCRDVAVLRLYIRIHDTALNLVDEWYGSLHKSKEPEIKEIGASLKDLKQLLKSGKATGHEIGEVLIEIGEQTAHTASDASKELKTPLQKLGNLHLAPPPETGFLANQ